VSRFEEFVLKSLAIVLVPVVAGLALYVKLLWAESTEADPYFNGYVAPIDMWGVVDYVQKSTVTIECKDSVGSGFSFRLSTKDEFNQWKFEVPKSDIHARRDDLNAAHPSLLAPALELQVENFVDLHEIASNLKEAQA